MIRPVCASDAEHIVEIYNHYVRHTTVTFEEDPVTADDISYRINAVTSAALPWIVIEEEDRVLGYAYAGKWHSRSAYRFTVETTVYLSHDVRGRGLGIKLYGALLEDLRAIGLHTVIGIIALPNDASVALHTKFGFQKTGQLDEVGRKFDQWVDVGFWQLVLRA